MKKLYVFLTAAMLTAAMASPAAAAGVLTAREARAAAQAAVPEGSVWVNTEDDDGRFEVRLYNDVKQEKYEVKVSRATGKVVSFDSERSDSRGGSQVALTEEQAKAIVTAEFPGAQILSCTLEKDDGLFEYHIEFTAESVYGEMDIHPQTGVVLERDLHVGTRPTPTDISTLITAKRAMELAQARVPSAIVTDVDLEREDGAWFYEVEMVKNGVEYNVILDAMDGKVLWSGFHHDVWEDAVDSAVSGQQTEKSILSDAEVRRIAQSRVPGAAIHKCKLDHDDGRLIYEIEMKKGGLEYELEIDAYSGSILNYEVDDD